MLSDKQLNVLCDVYNFLIELAEEEADGVAELDARTAPPAGTQSLSTDSDAQREFTAAVDARQERETTSEK